MLSTLSATFTENSAMMMYSSNYLVRQWFYVSVDQLLLHLQCLAVLLCAVVDCKQRMRSDV
jgi:hypothetical protein